MIVSFIQLTLFYENEKEWNIISSINIVTFAIRILPRSTIHITQGN